MNENKKKFRLMDAILAVICVVFVAEAAAPVAAIGNSQYFWWIFMIIGFLLPYGLISAELGTTYDGEGGLYDWISKAYGRRMGSRTAWYYWVNFPLWMASLAVMFPEIIGICTGANISTWLSLLIQLAFVWIVVWISFYPVSDSAWILNLSACIKLLLAAGIGVLGIYTAVTKGVANEYTVRSLLPSFDLNSLSYISVIIFNFLGFEVICTYAPTMQNPKKQIPQADYYWRYRNCTYLYFFSFRYRCGNPYQRNFHELRSDRQFQPAAFRSRRTGGYGADHRRSSVPADFIRKYDFLVFRGKQRSGLCGG